MVEEDSLAEAITNEPGKINFYKRGSQPPKLLEYKPVPADTFQELFTLNSEMENITNLNRVAITGEGGSSTRSTRQQQMAAESASKTMHQTRINIARGLTNSFRQLIRIYIQIVKPQEKRYIKFAERHDADIEWTKEDLTDNVRLKSESDTLSTIETKRADLAQANMIIANMRQLNGGMARPKQEKAVLAAMEFGLDTSEILITDKVAHDRVLREHQLLRNENIPPVVDQDDNHALHLEEHISYKLGEFSDRFSDLVSKGQMQKAMVEKQVLERHIAEHKKIVQRSQMRNQLMQEAANRK
jgi:hypothetical protein